MSQGGCHVSLDQSKKSVRLAVVQERMNRTE